MYVMTSKIVFPKWQDNNGLPLTIYKCSSVFISKSFKQNTQFAEITLPRNVRFFDKHAVRDLFRKGDEVIINLGYDSLFKEEFRGYITQIGADIPLVLKLEDEMYKIKRIPVNFSAKNITLSDLWKSLLKGHDYKVDALEVKLGDIRFAKTTIAEVIEQLKSTFNIYTYYQNGVLYSGKYYTGENSNIVNRFNLERNVVSNALNYKRKEDVIVKIDARSILADGKKIEFSLGEDGGDRLKLDYFNITLKAELEKKVKQDYENYKRGGFDGSFTAFGIPSVDFGEKAAIESIVYPERNGEYYIASVEKEFSKEGYRQIIKLDGTAKLEGNG